jgi:hypothetical protein
MKCRCGFDYCEIEHLNGMVRMGYLKDCPHCGSELPIEIRGNENDFKTVRNFDM